MVRTSLRIAAALAALPWLGILLLVVTGPATWSSLAYVLAAGALLLGLVTLPGGGRAPGGRRRGMCRAALGAIALTAIVRIAVARRGEHLALEHVDGDRAEAAGLVGRLVDEGDVALAGTRVLLASRLLRDDASELPSAMRAAYGRMRAAEGDVPSPLLPTYLGLEGSSSFDMLVLEPRRAPSTSAIVFLHGFAGNFDLPCWQIAQAVGDLGVTTACPSMRWVGDWSSTAGDATLRTTLALLRRRGAERIFLAGLSNGAIGAATLAPRLQGALAGLVLLSGASRDAPAAGIPTMVIQGARDTMVAPSLARSYARRTSAKYVEVDGGHFAMLVRAPEVDAAIRRFVGTQLARRPPVAAAP